jgi:hypothetical protein
VSATTTAPERPSAAPVTRADRGRPLARWLSIGALGAAAAGGLHIVVAAEHLSSGELAVGFFAFTALSQLGLAAWLLMHRWTGFRPDHRFVGTAVLGTVALMALYVVAHTTSLLDAFAVAGDSGSGGHSADHGFRTHVPGIDPVTGVDLSAGVAIDTPGPVAMAGEPVPVRHAPGALGPWTVAAEAVVLAALTALLPASWRRRATNAAVVLGGLAWALWFTGVLG